MTKVDRAVPVLHGMRRAAQRAANVGQQEKADALMKAVNMLTNKDLRDMLDDIETKMNAPSLLDPPKNMKGNWTVLTENDGR